MRKDSRECAFKVIFSEDFNKENFSEELYGLDKLNSADKEFCLKLLDCVIENYDYLTKTLESLSENYSADRLFKVDKTVIILAMAEIKFFNDIPSKVSIKEAIELAKKYSSEESIVFVNGILGKFMAMTESENG